MRRVQVQVGEEPRSAVLFEPGLGEREQGLRVGELLPAVHERLDISLVADLLEVQPEPGSGRSIGVRAEHDGLEAGCLQALRQGEGSLQQVAVLVGEVSVGMLGGEEGGDRAFGRGVLREVTLEEERGPSKAVDVGGGLAGVAVAAEMVGAGRIDDTDDEVRAGRGLSESLDRGCRASQGEWVEGLRPAAAVQHRERRRGERHYRCRGDAVSDSSGRAVDHCLSSRNRGAREPAARLDGTSVLPI